MCAEKNQNLRAKAPNFGRCSEKRSLFGMWKGSLAHLRFPDFSALFRLFPPLFRVFSAFVWLSKTHSTHETSKVMKKLVFSRKDRNMTHKRLHRNEDIPDTPPKQRNSLRAADQSREEANASQRAGEAEGRRARALKA